MNRKMRRALLVSRNGDGMVYHFIAFEKRREKISSKFLNTLGTAESLAPLIRDHEIDEVYFDLPSLTPEEMFHIHKACPGSVKKIHFLSDLYNTLSRKVHLKEIHGTPLFTWRRSEMSGFSRGIKRGMDIFGSLLALILLAPLFFTIALLIKGTMKGPIFFRQTRLGRGGRTFTFLKFRTMLENGENPHKDFVANFIRNQDQRGGTYKLREDPRITKVGILLRRTSMDELPQLFNVLRGEMSLVGPRPAIPYEFVLYQEWHKGRLSTKPGMTGLWQVSGRSSVSFNDMVLLDLYYIENLSIWLDLLILLKTIPAVFSEKGAY